MTPRCHNSTRFNGSLGRSATYRYERCLAITTEEAERAGLSAKDLRSRGSFGHIVIARYKAINRVSEEFPEMTSTAIGRFFNHDHTTILYALGRLRTRPRSKLLRKVRPQDEGMAA
jgi:chromosomal replication initiation ATPase DnaA